MDWRRDIMLWHPRLFRTMADEPSRSLGYPQCGRGWQDVLVRLCRRIETALGDRESFGFVRIVQKFGILRIDFDAECSEDTETAIVHAVNLAVARSACTCEICGREGRQHDDEGRLETRCAEHAAGTAVPSRYGEAIRRLRRRRGRPDMYFARYDRAADTLAEVPAPPKKER